MLSSLDLAIFWGICFTALPLPALHHAPGHPVLQGMRRLRRAGLQVGMDLGSNEPGSRGSQKAVVGECMVSMSSYHDLKRRQEKEVTTQELLKEPRKTIKISRRPLTKAF